MLLLHLILIYILYIYTEYVLKPLCIKREVQVDFLDFTFASPNIFAWQVLFFFFTFLYFHFDSLNCFCFCCEIAYKNKTEKLSCFMCVTFCSISPIWKLYIIPGKGTKSFFALKINHSSSNIYGVYYMRGAILETGHTKIKINIFTLIGFWHEIISRLKMILDDFKSKRRRVVDDITLISDTNI